MGKSIYQISNELAEIFDELEENGGELTDELNERLAINRDDAHEKILNLCNYKSLIEGKTSYLDSEIKRLTELKKQQENRVERVKEKIKEGLVLFGSKKQNDKGQTNYSMDLTTRKLYTSHYNTVEVEREELVPLNLHNETIVLKINSEEAIKVKEYLEKGNLNEFIIKQERALDKKAAEKYIETLENDSLDIGYRLADNIRVTIK